MYDYSKKPSRLRRIGTTGYKFSIHLIGVYSRIIW
jgi:hypothetical protein